VEATTGVPIVVLGAEVDVVDPAIGDFVAARTGAKVVGEVLVLGIEVVAGRAFAHIFSPGNTQVAIA